MGVVQHKHSKRTPQNHCVPILCKFHLGFCSEATFKRETESRSTNKLCIALARGSSSFIERHVLEKERAHSVCQ